MLGFLKFFAEKWQKYWPSFSKTIARSLPKFDTNIGF
jgi:hypothetical protein